MTFSIFTSDPIEWLAGSSSSCVYHCYNFTLKKCEILEELFLSLFTFKFGIFMTLSSWIVLAATIQIVKCRPIWLLWIDLCVNIITALSRFLLILTAYEFIVMKFPQYIQDMVVEEVCGSFPLASNEVSCYMLSFCEYANLWLLIYYR